MKNYLCLTIVVLAIVYWLFLLSPTLYFSNNIEYKSFKIHFSSKEINQIELQKVLDDTELLLTKSKLFNSTIKQNIFICQNKKEYQLFTLFNGSKFASYYPYLHNIFINKTVIQTKDSILQIKDNKQNPLSHIMANIIVFALLENELGLQKFLALPQWKKLGYASIIGKNNYYNEKLGYSNICIYNYTGNRNYKRFKYKVLTSYLLEDKNVSLHHFLNEEMNLKKINEQYCK